MQSTEKWHERATAWFLCRPTFLGIRIPVFLTYALSVLSWPDHWPTLTLAFFAAYNLGHGLFCLHRSLDGGAPLAAARGLIWRASADIALGACVFIGLLTGAAVAGLLLIAGLWLIGAVILEFRWLMHNHPHWERFFVTALATYLPFAYLLQVLFVLGRGAADAQLFSINAVAIALAAAASLAVLARVDLPTLRRRPGRSRTWVMEP